VSERARNAFAHLPSARRTPAPLSPLTPAASPRHPPHPATPPAGPLDGGREEDRGLLPRVLEYIFGSIAEAEGAPGSAVRFTCKASYLEIYNERVYDLLAPEAAGGGAGAGASSSAASKEPQSLQVRESAIRGVYVDGMTDRFVGTAAEAKAIMRQGVANRHTAATAMNRESSRSHSVFTLSIEANEKVPSDGTVRTRFSQFHLIDLAGSERQKLTGASGDRLREAGQINKSLSALGNVIAALTDVMNGRKDRHVPYRDSKLTWLLKDSLGGNSKTVLIATVSPGDDCFAETLSTLKFAARVKLIKNDAVINEDAVGSVAELQGLLKALRAEVAAKDGAEHVGGGGGWWRRAGTQSRYIASTHACLPPTPHCAIRLHPAARSHHCQGGTDAVGRRVVLRQPRQGAGVGRRGAPGCGGHGRGRIVVVVLCGRAGQLRAGG
jgi:hypothetical protein